MKHNGLLAAIPLLVLLGGCATGVGTPSVPVSIASPATEWTETDGFRAGQIRMDWWQELRDPELDRLIAEAMANNADLRAATANLAAAEALLREAKAAGLPSGSIAGGIERNRTPAAALQLETVGGPAFLPTQTLADVGAGLSWELDLSGRIAASQRAAGADRDRALWARRSAEAAVTTGVVRAWIDLGAAREQLTITEQRVATLREIAASLNAAVRLGGVRPDQRDSLLAELRLLEAATPALGASQRNAARRLATLTGKPAPQGVQGIAKFKATAMPVPRYVLAPEPAELLRLRPDVAQAEQDLRKATAGIAIAKSELYPRISFGGSAGLTAGPSDLFSTGALRFGIGPSISWGIFDMGRIKARIRVAGGQAEAAAAAWESTFLRAIEETDSSLDQLAAARRSWSAAEAAHGLAKSERERSALRFAAGQDSRLADLQVAERRLAAQLREVEARTAALQSWVNVQVAFGAGWRS